MALLYVIVMRIIAVNAFCTIVIMWYICKIRKIQSKTRGEASGVTFTVTVQPIPIFTIFFYNKRFILAPPHHSPFTKPQTTHEIQIITNFEISDCIDLLISDIVFVCIKKETIIFNETFLHNELNASQIIPQRNTLCLLYWQKVICIASSFYQTSL